MTTIVYKARKKFRYGDKRLKIGDVWEPVGGKWDEYIKKYHVVAEEVPEPGAAPKRVTRRKKADVPVSK